MRNSNGQFSKGKSEFVGQKRPHISGENNPNYKEKIWVRCMVCRKDFPIHPYRITTARFCSRPCVSLWIARTFASEKSPNWKGDKVSYTGLHQWVKRHLGSPKQCEFCGKLKTTSKSIQWANKSHKYLRKLTDWISLCASCHKKYDLETKK